MQIIKESPTSKQEEEKNNPRKSTETETRTFQIKTSPSSSWTFNPKAQRSKNPRIKVDRRIYARFLERGESKREKDIL